MLEAHPTTSFLPHSDRLKPKDDNWLLFPVPEIAFQCLVCSSTTAGDCVCIKNTCVCMQVHMFVCEMGGGFKGGVWKDLAWRADMEERSQWGQRHDGGFKMSGRDGKWERRQTEARHQQAAQLRWLCDRKTQQIHCRVAFNGCVKTELNMLLLYSLSFWRQIFFDSNSF